MTSRIISAGIYYHQKYPGFIIFYRIGDHYVAFQEDAEKAAPILRLPVYIMAESIPFLPVACSEFLDAVEYLATCSISAKGIIYRDKKGECAVPDVKFLSEESEADY